MVRQNQSLLFFSANNQTQGLIPMRQYSEGGRVGVQTSPEHIVS